MEWNDLGPSSSTASSFVSSYCCFAVLTLYSHQVLANLLYGFLCQQVCRPNVQSLSVCVCVHACMRACVHDAIIDVVSDIAIFVLKRDVKIQLTN